MKLDNKNQKTRLLELPDHMQFPGIARNEVYQLGQAIEHADLEQVTSTNLSNSLQNNCDLIGIRHRCIVASYRPSIPLKKS